MATVKGEGGAQARSRTFTFSLPAGTFVLAKYPLPESHPWWNCQISSRNIQAPWTIGQLAPFPISGTLITLLKFRLRLCA